VVVFYPQAKGGSSLEPPIPTIVESFAQDLVKALRDAAVSLVLYGSTARGEDRPDSDIDLLLIAEDGLKETEGKALGLKAEYLYRERRAFSVITYSRQDFAFAVKQGFPLVLGVASGYRVLHDPSGFFREQMKTIEAMEAAGLVKRYSRGWVWVTQSGL